MHVLAITDYLNNVGGAELSARAIVTALVTQESIDGVTVVGVDLPGEERLKYPGVNIVSVDPPVDPRRFPDYVADEILARALARRVDRLSNDFDVVHAHHRRSTLALARTGTAVPTVSTVRDFWPICPISVYHVDGQQCTGCDGNLGECVAHQGWDDSKPKAVAVKQYLLAKRRQQRPALSSMDCGVFIADHLRRTIAESLELPKTVTRIPNPVSLPDDSEPSVERASEPTFVTASSLTAEKGVDTAVRAMERVIESYPEARIVVFGDGQQQKDLEALASEVAPGAVDFRGRVPPRNVYREMASATATIFPSVWAEPFGRITVESMMLGTPVIGSSIGGIAEVIDDGETGLLFPPGDDTALAEALVRILDAPEWATEIAAKARDSTDDFEPANVAASYVDVFDRLVA